MCFFSSSLLISLRVLGPELVVDLGRWRHDVEKVVDPLNFFVMVLGHLSPIAFKLTSRWIIRVALLLFLWELKEVMAHLL